MKSWKVAIPKRVREKLCWIIRLFDLFLTRKGFIAIKELKERNSISIRTIICLHCLNNSIYCQNYCSIMM